MYMVWFDGACGPQNPGGSMGYGARIEDEEGVVVHEIAGFVAAGPENSNNVAEYLALLKAMEWFLERDLATADIHAMGDSQLVINQVWGRPGGGRRWAIKSGRYAVHAKRVLELLGEFPRMTGEWVPRERNQPADDLSKAELRKRGISPDPPKFKKQEDLDWQRSQQIDRMRRDAQKTDDRSAKRRQKKASRHDTKAAFTPKQMEALREIIRREFAAIAKKEDQS